MKMQSTYKNGITSNVELVYKINVVNIYYVEQ